MSFFVKRDENRPFILKPCKSPNIRCCYPKLSKLTPTQILIYVTHWTDQARILDTYAKEHYSPKRINFATACDEIFTGELVDGILRRVEQHGATVSRRKLETLTTEFVSGSDQQQQRLLRNRHPPIAYGLPAVPGVRCKQASNLGNTQKAKLFTFWNFRLWITWSDLLLLNISQSMSSSHAVASSVWSSHNTTKTIRRMLRSSMSMLGFSISLANIFLGASVTITSTTWGKRRLTTLWHAQLAESSPIKRSRWVENLEHAKLQNFINKKDKERYLRKKVW